MSVEFTMSKFQRICLGLFLVIALGPQVVGNIMMVQQALHDSDLVYENDLLGIRISL